MNLMSDGERQSRLQHAMTHVGWQGEIAPLSPYQFQMITRAPKVNHVLHLLLTIFTAGLWLIVWFFIAATQSQDSRQIVSVDAYGNVWIGQKLWWPAPTPAAIEQAGHA